MQIQAENRWQRHEVAACPRKSISELKLLWGIPEFHRRREVFSQVLFFALYLFQAQNFQVVKVFSLRLMNLFLIRQKD